MKMSVESRRKEIRRKASTNGLLDPLSSLRVAAPDGRWLRALRPTLGFGLLTACLACQAQSEQPIPTVLPAGAVLRVQVDHRSRVSAGSRVRGHLTEALYLRDHLVVPAGTEVSGVVQDTHPAPKGTRTAMLINGDFTPPRVPDVVFDQILLPAKDGQPAHSLPINAPAVERNASVVRLGASGKKPSLFKQATGVLRQKKDNATHTNKTEFVEKYVLNQLPYHPLEIWTNDGFDGTLSVPATLADTSPMPIALSPYTGVVPSSPLRARLISAVSSADAVKGTDVHAVVTEPLFTDDKKLLLAEGAEIQGTVVQVKPARKYGKNGTLRFTFNHIALGTPGDGPPTELHGHLSATEADGKDHVSLDDEGQVKTSDGPAKYAAPALLAVLTFASFPDSNDTAGNGGAGGFGTSGTGGLIGRVVASAADPVVSETLASVALARSVYTHFLAKGHQLCELIG